MGHAFVVCNIANSRTDRVNEVYYPYNSPIYPVAPPNETLRQER